MAEQRGHIILVDNFICTRSGERVTIEVSPHLGLMILAALLEGAGHRVEIFDPKIMFDDGDWPRPDGNFLAAWGRVLAERGPDIVGFTAYGRTLPYAVGAAESFRRARPATPVLIGGPHATILGRRILEAFACFDVVVRYEAEPVIEAVVARLLAGRALAGIPNLVYRDAGTVVATPLQLQPVALDELPAPALHLYPADRVAAAQYSVEAGRGCPFKCTFCSTASFFQRKYRLKSNRQLIAEIDDVVRRYGVGIVNLNHDLFGLKVKSLREFCALITGRELEWTCSMRPDTLAPDLPALLAAAGCRHLYFGIETGSPRLQDSIKKRLDLRQSRQVIASVIATGMACTTSFITGFTDETVDDQNMTLDMIGELLLISPARVHVQLHMLSPEPGSELAERGLDIAFDGIGPEVDDFADPALIAALPDIFSVFYHYRADLPRWRSVLASAFVTYLLPQMGMPLAAFLLRHCFDGRLSAMFEAVAPTSPGPLSSYNAVIEHLWRGIRAAGAQAGADAQWLEELLRFSRITESWIRTRRDQTCDEAPPIFLSPFNYDILTLVGDIIADKPEKGPPQRGTSERWYLFSSEGDDAPSVWRVPTPRAHQIAEVAGLSGSDAGVDVRLFVPGSRDDLPSSASCAALRGMNNDERFRES